ncbi:nucleopolyhedrovirus P10 family protein [Streptomyces sp. S465]|uniref:nucleopolyhedrovirus P10 family protein n=1 Tax=Streptomyces sp. S465 TaxID=2979468 RepID=UPI0022A86800|nr:nucleopolyhedrovirus P10 family protein [Streptomyces sp. S465]WAP55315.1 nucleopolyhedrovirus P10 family protein [Streptomyces sp. S465]
MVVTDRLAQTVREQLRLGRLLPLGGPEDGSWITEHAASEVLGRAAHEVTDARLEALRIGPADPDTASTPAVPPPPSALPPGPLRIAAECGATLEEALPVTADRLREVLLDEAADRLGLLVEAVDVRVTKVLEEPQTPQHHPQAPAEPQTPQHHPKAPTEPQTPQHHPKAPTEPQPPQHHPPQPQPTPRPTTERPEPPDRATSVPDPATRAAASVPGVARLTPVLGSSRAVRIEGAHIRIELAVAAGHRALDVARAVRTAVAEAVPPPEDQPTTVAVLVTAVDP